MKPNAMNAQSLFKIPVLVLETENFQLLISTHLLTKVCTLVKNICQPISSLSSFIYLISS